MSRKQHTAFVNVSDYLDTSGRNVNSHLLHSALFLNLALSEFLQQNQLSLLDSQFFFQLLDDVLSFFRRTLLHVPRKALSATQWSPISQTLQ